MARFRSFVVLGAASAALAGLVPGVFDPAMPARVTIAETAPLAIPDVAPVPKLTVPPATTPAAAQRRRSVVPTGCERLVSPLARSAASSTASRCIT